MHVIGLPLGAGIFTVWCLLALLFSWEPALWLANSQGRVWMLLLSKKIIDIFNFKQRLLSIDMKTKVVQYVPRINLNNLKFQIFKNFQIFKFSLVPTFCLTFRHFLVLRPPGCKYLLLSLSPTVVCYNKHFSVAAESPEADRSTIVFWFLLKILSSHAKILQ